jgi:hypothetical protein
MCKQYSSVNTTCVGKVVERHFQQENESCDKT